MNKHIDLYLHGAIAFLWMSMAMGICLTMALHGNEKAALARSRGESLRSRADLICKKNRLHSIIDQQTSPTALDTASKTLNPPLLPPRLARRPTTGTPAVAMTMP